MGGPIKQGIMHGIREPKKHGGPTGTGLVGDQRYPRTGGREHHGFFIPPILMALGLGTGARVAGGAAIRAAGSAAARRAAQEAATKAALAGGVKKGLKTASGTGITAAAPTGLKGWLARDPLVKSALWAKDALMSPASKGFGKSALRFATAPSSLGVLGYMGAKKLMGGEDEIDPPTGINKPGGFPGKEKAVVKELSEAQKKAFANKQREERVQKYLDMMGYDRAKKTAIADALIDASKIVGDRGTLDLKNINRELINPVIQATSKRLDKPEQIREAVGLMSTKAEIEKDVSAETDALAKKLTLAKIKSAEAGLEATESFEGGMKAFLTLRKGAVAANELEQMARILANEHNEPFTKVTEDTDITTLDNGIYMSGTKIIRLTDGVPKQLV